MDLLPDVVTGKQPPRRGTIQGVDLATLTHELVQQGLADSGAEEGDLHAKIVNGVERELIRQVMEACNEQPDQSRREAGHQPQHPAQEAGRVPSQGRAGGVARSVAGEPP